MTTSAAPAANNGSARPKYKRSFKNYLLDPRFQLKWTGMIIGVAFVISAIMGVFLYRTSSEVTAAEPEGHRAGAGAHQGEPEELRPREDADREGVRRRARARRRPSPRARRSSTRSSSVKQKALLSQQQATIHQQNTMLTSLVAGLALLVVLIGILGIYFTHKVVGPIYKMKMLLRQVGDGKLNFYGKLRKGDELQDFFEVFAQMVEKLKDRQRREVTELEAAMDAAQGIRRERRRDREDPARPRRDEGRARSLRLRRARRATRRLR